MKLNNAAVEKALDLTQPFWRHFPAEEQGRARANMALVLDAVTDVAFQKVGYLEQTIDRRELHYSAGQLDTPENTEDSTFREAYVLVAEAAPEESEES